MIMISGSDNCQLISSSGPSFGKTEKFRHQATQNIKFSIFPIRWFWENW